MRRSTTKLAIDGLGLNLLAGTVVLSIGRPFMISFLAGDYVIVVRGEDDVK